MNRCPACDTLVPTDQSLLERCKAAESQAEMWRTSYDQMYREYELFFEAVNNYSPELCARFLREVERRMR